METWNTLSFSYLYFDIHLSGCGLINQNGNPCCKTTGNSDGSQICVSNGNNSCKSKEFGGIPGDGSAEVCNQLEVFSADGSNQSCLLSDANIATDCLCYPSSTKICPEVSGTKRVCRDVDLVINGGDSKCDACRECMINGPNGNDGCVNFRGLAADFTTEAGVEATMTAWSAATPECTARGDLCALQCVYDPNP